MKKIWNVAIYVRVSTEKESQSESTGSQIANLKKYLLDEQSRDLENLYNIVDSYIDEGKSGTNFERDGFKRMLDDVEKGRVNMVLTRDLSRFSRNYIKAGYYLEEYFLVKDVRFVSVLDGVDTFSEFNDIIPFKNILNEMYVKDCSKRIRSALGERMFRGSSIASKPPYGYVLEEEQVGNQKKIILREEGGETTETVKKIFQLYKIGYGIGRIATYLNSQGILPPSARLPNFKNKKFGKWNNNTIKSILTNQKYAGYMVQGKYRRVSYKIKRTQKLQEDAWVWGDEFEGIIAKEEFKEVQEMMGMRGKGYRYKGNNIHPFTQALKCGGCGGSMCYRKSYEGYKCTNSQTGGKRCTPHSIKEVYLIEEITKYIREVIGEGLDREKYYKKAKEIKLGENLEKKLEGIEKKLETEDKKFQKLYVDKLEEKITERNFNVIAKGIQEKQKKLEEKKITLESQISDKGKDKVDYYSIYKKEIDKLLDLKEIDRNFVNALIKEIIVKENQKKEKVVEFHFKFNK